VTAQTGPIEASAVTPKPQEVAVLSLQHALLALIFLIYPLAAAQTIGLSPADTGTFLTGSLIAIGVATCLHYFPPPFGSGSLAVEIPTPIFLPVTIMAGAAGGWPLMCGMALVCGVVEVVFARALRVLRALFPAEVCGVAVFMLGVSIAKPGLAAFSGVTVAGAVIDVRAIATAVATLLTIVGLGVFGTRRVRLLALGLGVLVGMTVAILTGLVGPADWARIEHLPWVGLPAVSIPAPRFDVALLPLCIVMGVALSIDNLGCLVGIQRQRDPQWAHVDIRQASGGIQVSGIGDIVAGLLGGMPTGVSSSNIGLSHATGVSHRIVALYTGVLLLLASVAPKIIAAIALMPRPVVGAIMVYAAAYMMVSGMTLILSRMLSERRVFAVGFALLVGLAPLLVSGLYEGAPSMVRALLESPIAAGSLTAMVLTAIAKIGIRQRSVTTLDEPSRSTAEQLSAFLEQQGGRWGARRDVMLRATSALVEGADIIASSGGRRLLMVRASFDDSVLRLDLVHSGAPLVLDTTRQTPPSDDLLAPEVGANELDAQMKRVGIVLLRHFADHVEARGDPNRGEAPSLRLGFEHG